MDNHQDKASFSPSVTDSTSGEATSWPSDVSHTPDRSPVSPCVGTRVVCSALVGDLIDLSPESNRDCSVASLLNGATSCGVIQNEKEDVDKSDSRALQDMENAKFESCHDQTNRVNPQTGAHSSTYLRGVASSNWRVNHDEGLSTLGPPMMFKTPFDSVGRQQMLPTSSSPTLEQHVSNTRFVSDPLLDDSFAYCYHRGNGQYTRLIPADLLPPMHNIPSVQHGCAGMIVVNEPRGLPTNGQPGPSTRIVMKDAGKQAGSSDQIQSRIDNIVAASPHQATTYHKPKQPGAHHGKAHAKADKIWCDKWIHEGSCAFTQQGCKYKHEMPLDRTTQISVGLFHGLPPWYKKHQAELMKTRDEPTPPMESSQYGRSIKNTTKPDQVRYQGRTGLDADQHSLDGKPGWQLKREQGEESEKLTPSVIGGVAKSRLTTASRASSHRASLAPKASQYGSPYGPIAPPARGHATKNRPTITGNQHASRGHINESGRAKVTAEEDYVPPHLRGFQ